MNQIYLIYYIHFPKRLFLKISCPKQILVNKIKDQKHKLVDRKITKDDKNSIKEILLDWLKNKEVDVIITTGGTGLTGRDITPEAIKEIADKETWWKKAYPDLDYQAVVSRQWELACEMAEESGDHFVVMEVNITTKHKGEKRFRVYSEQSDVIVDGCYLLIFEPVA